MARIAVGSLGGTITMTSSTPVDPPGSASMPSSSSTPSSARPGGASASSPAAPNAAGGVRPTLTAEQLVASVPGLDRVAKVTAHTLATLPGASLQLDDLAAAFEWAQQQVDAGADGIVLIQGTDTLEESAYQLDLWWDRPEPLVFTGAMRPPQAASADGPANVLAAVTTASAVAARSRGVLVVMGDQVHHARSVTKRHSSSPAAFSSGDHGLAGQITEGTFEGLAPVGVRPDPLPCRPRSSSVAVIGTHLGDDGSLLKALASSGYDGAVLAAMGGGHLPLAVADALTSLPSDFPVVLATRVGGGRVLTSTYAFPGSESDLLGRGLLPAGWLDPLKARILLNTLLDLGLGPLDVASAFADRCRASGGDAASPSM